MTVSYYKDAHEQLKRVYDDNVEMVREHSHFIERYQHSLKQHRVNTFTNEDRTKWAERDTAFLSRIHTLQRRIQKESRREVIER